MTENLLNYFKKNPGLNIADAAYTLQTGRKTFSTKKEKKIIVFMFPGQGSQYVDMGREEISLAAVNSSQLCVVSGSSPAIDCFEADINADGVKTRRLHTSQAFHSVMMDPILEEFKGAFQQVSTVKLQIPYISNLTGKLAELREVAEPIYWSKHIRQTVQFSQGVEVLLGHKNAVFIEVGPGQTLGTFIRQHTAKENSHKIINLIRHPDEKTNDLGYLLEKIGELWLYGVSPQWDDFHQGQLVKRVSLPTYSFEKIKYPIGMDVFKIIKSFCGGSRGAVFSKSAPLVAEGKKIQTKRPEMATAYIEASTPMERDLQEIWENFFHIDRIGIKDNFFELGGDSLKAMALSTKIQERLHVDIRVADFFVNPTIKNLAGYIGSSKKKELVSIDPVEEKEYYPVS